MLVEDGILLRKYWFSVSDEEQERRFRSRVSDPMRQWKFSENDLLARARWVEFSRAKDEMFVFTDLPEAPWYVIEADDKRRARINMISHLLESLPYERIERPTITLPPRPPAQDYQRPPRELFNQVPDRAEQLVAEEAQPGEAKKSAKADKSAAKAGGKKARSGGKPEAASPAATGR
jgi:hypothetical protein